MEYINSTLVKYIEGTANGNPDKLRDAFHKDFKLFLVEDDTVKTIDGEGYIQRVERGKKYNRIGRIVSIDYENDAASAKIEVYFPDRKRIATDYLLLLKIKGRWKILHKIINLKTLDENQNKKTNTQNEINLINETLTNYIEGTSNGEPNRLKKAFHKGFNLYYIKNDNLSIIPGEQYIRNFKKGKKNKRIGKVLSVAYEGGKLIGEFLRLTSDFDEKQQVEVIPKFHDMSFRYTQFENALKVASKERLEVSKDYIKIIENSKEEMHILLKLKQSGTIKTRVTHNDTKISNVLFNEKNKGICVIDTDTVMPGIIHYDFGDAIRTICNTAAEDETNLDLVEFNTAYYNAYKKGFLKHMKSSITPLELKYLPLGAKTMIFIMALRFLTDYLNGDIYYKTKYLEHNLDRAKNQFKLLESLSRQLSGQELKINSNNKGGEDLVKSYIF